MYELLMVEKRMDHHSVHAKNLRKVGIVPAIMFAKGMASVEYKITEANLRKCLSVCGPIIEIQAEDGVKHLVTLEEIQKDPVTKKVLHISFHKLKKTNQS